jgi:hypothetical protein
MAKEFDLKTSNVTKILVSWILRTAASLSEFIVHELF